VLVPKEEQDKKTQKKGIDLGVCLKLDFYCHFLKDKNVSSMILYQLNIKILLSQLVYRCCV